MWKNIIHCPLILFGTLLQFCSPMMPVVRTGRVSSMTRFMSTLGEALVLNPEETAVVFIEYQNEFTTEGGKLHGAVKECMEKTNMLENSAKLARVAREAGCTVIHAPIAFEPVGGRNISTELARNAAGYVFSPQWDTQPANIPLLLLLGA